MKRAFLLIIVALLGGCADKGQCLTGHTVQVGDSGFFTNVDFGNGVIVPIWNDVPAHDEYQCDTWEFPNGKPKKAK